MARVKGGMNAKQKHNKACKGLQRSKKQAV